MTTEELIASLEVEISEIKEEMKSEKSVSVDGKISVSNRDVKELSAILAMKQNELDILKGVNTGGFGNSAITVRARRGGFN